MQFFSNPVKNCSKSYTKYCKTYIHISYFFSIIHLQQLRYWKTKLLDTYKEGRGGRRIYAQEQKLVRKSYRQTIAATPSHLLGLLGQLLLPMKRITTSTMLNRLRGGLVGATRNRGNRGTIGREGGRDAKDSGGETTRVLLDVTSSR